MWSKHKPAWQYTLYICADDIISRFPKSLWEATIALDKAARMMGLEINQDKTKYMICGAAMQENRPGCAGRQKESGKAKP
jgi:hypothetical protein